MTGIFPNRKKAVWGQQGRRGSEQQAEQGARLEPPQLVSAECGWRAEWKKQRSSGFLLSLPWDASLPHSHTLASSALIQVLLLYSLAWALFSGLAAAARAWKEFSSW